MSMKKGFLFSFLFLWFCSIFYLIANMHGFHLISFKNSETEKNIKLEPIQEQWGLVHILANMSGKASEEINSLLDNSISRVNRIVQDSNSNMAKLSVQGQKVLKEGITKSNHSIDIINKVVENMKRNSGLMNSIATASDEQSKGVNEITQAIQSINSSNQENISLINELKSLSEQMDYESKNLDKVVQNINETLIGSNKNAA